MRNRFYALGLALLFTLSAAAPALAATPQASADWTAVRALATGEKIAVRLKDGDRLKGRFDSASETEITFTEDGRRVSLKRDSIGRVEVARGRNRLTGALLGAGIGGGAGAGIGTGLIASSDHFQPSIIPAGTAVGIGVGAAIGAAVGLGTNYDTIYLAY